MKKAFKETQSIQEEKLDISKKCLLTMSEAGEYTGLGTQKLRDISNSENCDFVLWNGSKRMFNRERLRDYLYSLYSI